MMVQCCICQAFPSSIHLPTSSLFTSPAASPRRASPTLRSLRSLRSRRARLAPRRVKEGAPPLMPLRFRRSSGGIVGSEPGPDATRATRDTGGRWWVGEGPKEAGPFFWCVGRCLGPWDAEKENTYRSRLKARSCQEM